jgi:hypothetical protein
MTADPQRALRASLRDTVDFIIEQVELARSPEDRLAAIGAAQGVIPFLRSQLKKDEYLAANFAIVLDVLIDANQANRVWIEKANDPPDVFAEFADDVVGRLNSLKDVLDASVPSHPSRSPHNI